MHDSIWLRYEFQNRAARHLPGLNEPAGNSFQRLAETVDDVSDVLIEAQQLFWERDAQTAAIVWKGLLEEIAWGDLTAESGDLEAVHIVCEFYRRMARAWAAPSR